MILTLRENYPLKKYTNLTVVEQSSSRRELIVKNVSPNVTNFFEIKIGFLATLSLLIND